MTHDITMTHGEHTKTLTYEAVNAKQQRLTSYHQRRRYEVEKWPPGSRTAQQRAVLADAERWLAMDPDFCHRLVAGLMFYEWLAVHCGVHALMFGPDGRMALGKHEREA